MRWIENQQTTDTRKIIYSEKALASPQHTDVASACLLIIGRPLDTIAPLDTLLEQCNALLADGGTLCCMATPSAVKQEQLRNRFPWPVRHIAVGTHYLWHRMCSKLWVSRGLYRVTTGEHNRSMSRVEILGRLCHAGFETTTQRIQDDTLTLCAVRSGEPFTEPPHLGAIIALPRIGKGGKEIPIYKLRTMYAYSEFLQATVYSRHRLAQSGKFAHDYRVTIPGRWLRSHWIDECPMIVNLLRGDIKIVGVRPLSKHFFQLYSPEMQQLRTQHKPGLLPPLYACNNDIQDLNDIERSEREYLEAYARHPLRTDWQYFWRIMSNIILHRRRSA